MNLLFLTFVFPLIGFLLLSFSRGRFSENLSALIGVGSVGLSAATAAYVIWQFNVAPPEGGAYSQLLWQWMSVDGFAPTFTLHLDGLSVTMLGVVTGVGFLIHLFASWYMRGEAGYSRFFSYTNLFIASMLFLILGDNLLFIYFGWEGVGLCSYLLIGFYYSNRNNGNAALKAFIVTRIGDVFMAIGLFILFAQLGTLNVQELLVLAPQKFQAGDTWMVLATLMLLGGAVGKSAQLPLQTWLADAMAGQVSGLITTLDLQLRELRREWQRNPEGFGDFALGVLQALPPGFVTHISVTNADGYVVYDSLDTPIATFIGDRAHFQAQRDGEVVASWFGGVRYWKGIPAGLVAIAVGTAIACYTLWGLLPLLFMAMAAHGFGAPEILAHRAVWSVFVAGLVLLLAAICAVAAGLSRRRRAASCKRQFAR